MTLYDIFFNDDNDMELDGADLAFADENNIVKQRLTLRLQFLLEEWFLDTTKGIPYTQVVFAQNSSLDDVYAIFRKHILETKGVFDIVSLDFTLGVDNRMLTIVFSVNKGTITDSLEVTI